MAILMQNLSTSKLDITQYTNTGEARQWLLTTPLHRTLGKDELYCQKGSPCPNISTSTEHIRCPPRKHGMFKTAEWQLREGG